jgi:hypothetical protein
VPVEQVWTLARLWYHDRLDRGWQRPTRAVAAAAFARAGLSGEFWSFDRA